MNMFITKNGISVGLTGELQDDVLICNLTLTVADNYTLYVQEKDGTILRYTCNIIEDLQGNSPLAQYRVRLVLE